MESHSKPFRLTWRETFETLPELNLRREFESREALEAFAAKWGISGDLWRRDACGNWHPLSKE